MITGKVLSKELDQDGNIKVTTEYTLTNGSKKVGHTRYAYWNYTAAKVAADVKAHCETLMRRVYALKQHHILIDTVPVVGIKHDCTQTTIVTKPKIVENGVVIQEQETMIIDDK